jgi:hypothetical protein
MSDKTKTKTKTKEPRLLITKKAREELDRAKEIQQEKERLRRLEKEKIEKERRERAKERRLEKDARKRAKKRLLEQAKGSDEQLRLTMRMLQGIDDKIIRVYKEGEKLESDYVARVQAADEKIDTIKRKMAVLEEQLRAAEFDYAKTISDKPLTRSDLMNLKDERIKTMPRLRESLAASEAAWKALEGDGAYTHNAAQRARSKHRDINARRKAKTILEA